mgnify:CR=1 FL=1
MAQVAPILLAFLTLISVVGCSEDPRRAQEGAKWLQERYLFRPFGNIGEISKIYVSDAELIRMEVLITNQEHADAINAQSLMLQSLIAKYACPRKASKLWEIVGEDVTIRVDLKTDTETVSSAICKPE